MFEFRNKMLFKEKQHNVFLLKTELTVVVTLNGCKGLSIILNINSMESNCKGRRGSLASKKY